jgi:hypothetical protein
MSTLTAYSAADGSPLAGLTPTWHGYIVATTGADKTPQATFVGLGDGQYRVDGATSDACGVVDWGATADPRYTVFSASTEAVFLALDFDGAPLTGLTPTWASFKTEATGADASQPTVSELAYGLYRIVAPAAGKVGLLDLGTSALQRYQKYAAVGGGDTTPPVVAAVSPAPGATIASSTALVVDVTDGGGFRRIFVNVSFPAKGLDEVVHDGDAFSPLYARASTRETISGGYRFTLIRLAGWPASPTLKVHAIDTAGNEPS